MNINPSHFVRLASSILVAGLLTLSAQANQVTFQTSAGANIDGNPINVKAVFTTSAGNLNIALTNLTYDPNSVIQNVSGLWFTLGGGQMSSTLTNSSGMERDVATNGSFTDLGSGSTGWLLSNNFLNVLGSPIGPAHTLLGVPPGAAYDANGSIAGNDPHNPFLAGTITFNIAFAGLTAADMVTSTTFQFGTTAGKNYTPPMTPPVTVPDSGSTAILVGLGLVGAAVLARRKNV